MTKCSAWVEYTGVVEVIHQPCHELGRSGLRRLLHGLVTASVAPQMLGLEFFSLKAGGFGFCFGLSESSLTFAVELVAFLEESAAYIVGVLIAILLVE